MKKLTIVFLFVTQISFAQSKLVLETIHEIEFKQDTIKSVFDWLTDNIKYDVKKLNKIKKPSKSKKDGQFKSEAEYKEYLLEKVVKQKKGVCEDYSLLFDAIVRELGFESYIIEGYTKASNAKVNKKLGHTWNAIKVNQEWRLYDATWGAGFVKNDKKFIKNYNPQWYDVDPGEMIKTHMPFDPMWQLLSSPMSYEAFEDNLETVEADENYTYSKRIDEYLRKEKNLQMKDKVNRSLEMGNGIRLIDKWRRRIQKQIDLYGVTSQQDLLEEAHNASNRAVESFNRYIKAKNKQFKGTKWTIEKGEQDLMDSKEEMEAVLGIYKGIEVEDRKAINIINKNIRKSEKLLKEINKELAFLNEIKSN